MMKKVLMMLLTLMTVNTSMMQAQLATQGLPDRDAVHFKSTPVKATAWESLALASIQDVSEEILWDFENDNHGWTVVDSDGDGYCWSIAEDDNDYSAHSGSRWMMSESYIIGHGPLQPDNWLISPQVALDGELSLWAMNYVASYPDRFAVYACIGEPSGPDSFIKISDDIVPSGMWDQYTFDLSRFNGQVGCIAIRHYNSYDMYKLFIDDVKITYFKTPTPTITCDFTDYGVEVIATGEGHVILYMDDTLVAEGEGWATYILDYGGIDVEYVFCAYAQAPRMSISDPAILEVVVPPRPVIELPAPWITYEMTEESIIVTATGEGYVTLYVEYYDNWTGEATTVPYGGVDYTVSVEIPRTEDYYFVNVWAVAEMDGAYPGISQTEFIEVPPYEKPLEFTETPAIAIEETDEGVNIVVAGNGVLYLYINEELVLFGEEFLEYFIPCDGHEGMTYIVTASAQEDGKEMSEYIMTVVHVRGRSYAPEIYYEVVGDCYYVYAQAYEAEVYFFLNGVSVENPFVAHMTDEEQVLEFSAFAMESGHYPSETVYFTVVIPAKPQFATGDADGDGVVTISDVSVIIDYILSGSTSDIVIDGADVNHDGSVSIVDVSILIDYLLNGTW